MLSRRRFLRFLPAVTAAPLVQPIPPARPAKTEQEKHNDRVDGQILYLLSSDKGQNRRLSRIERRLPNPDPFERYRKKTL